MLDGIMVLEMRTASRQNRKTRPIAERFASKVDRNGPVPKRRPDLGSCHLWLGTKDKDGYGIFGMVDPRVGKFITRRATRVAYLLKYGEWPDAHACHHCDNPPCVNPDHLFVGTDLDNVRDMIEKNRHPHGETHGMVLHPECRARGEAHGIAKLNDAKVVEIRRALAVGESHSSIARRFGVCRMTIANIAHGRIWTHVPSK